MSVCATKMKKAIVLADSQGKYFHQYLEENGVLTLFNSGDRIKDLHKHLDILPSFRIVVIQIGSNDIPRDNAAEILRNKQILYQHICSLNPEIQVCVV